MASSNFIVSAIKFRPNTFAEVLAQDHITRTLLHSLKRGQIANAYLFSGPRGTGKTTTARILAKALNCENPQEGEPCNQCQPCHAITQGTFPDVLELDAATNSKVEQMRQLLETVRFSPSIGRYKVYIIDECHMLSDSAINALLKTLEEPPPYCRFIFATTELNKILPTILSRCQRYPFRRIPAGVIAEHLRNVLRQQTEVELADPSQLDRILFLLARSSEGCLRDALFSLDQLIAFCSGKLELAEVEEIMGAIDFDLLDRYVRALIEHDLPVILDIIENLSNHGKEISLFLAECLQFIRNLAVVKIAPQNFELLDLPEEYRNQLNETASLTSLEQILYITDQLWDAEQRIRYSSLGRLILEMASIKAAKAGQAIKIEDLIKKISSGGGASIALPVSLIPAPAPKPTATVVHLPAAKPQPVSSPQSAPPPKTGQPKTNLSPIEPPRVEPPLPIEAYENLEPPEETVEPVVEAPKVPVTRVGDSLSAIWRQFLHELESADPVLAGALEGSVALDISGEILSIAIPSDNLFCLRTVERPNNQKILSKLLHQSFGKKLTLRCEASDELNQINQKFAQDTPQQPAASRQELMKKLEQNKVFSKLMEEMPGRVVDIKPV